MTKSFKMLFIKWTSMEYFPRYSRLLGDMDSYEPMLLKRTSEKDNQEKPWAVRAKELLAKSRKFLDQYKIDEAWKAFHATKRMEIFGMSDSERIELADELRKETAKLNKWRSEAILELIGSTKEAGKVPTPEALNRAVELKDEYYNNQYYKNRLTRSLFSLLFTLLFFVIAGIIIYLLVQGEDITLKEAGQGMELSEYIIGVLLFGLLGAITSAILFTRYLSESTRITELGSNRMITLSKIFVGAAFTLFIFLLLRSSIAESIKLFNFSIDSPLDYFAIAFVSGFSEQLAQKAIGTIVGKDNGEVKTPTQG